MWNKASQFLAKYPNITYVAIGINILQVVSILFAILLLLTNIASFGIGLTLPLITMLTGIKGLLDWLSFLLIFGVLIYLIFNKEINLNSNTKWFYLIVLIISILLVQTIGSLLIFIPSFLSINFFHGFFTLPILYLTLRYQNINQALKKYGQLINNHLKDLFIFGGWLILAGLSNILIIAFWYIFPRYVVSIRLRIDELLIEKEEIVIEL